VTDNGSTRNWLDVPFGEKDEAKSLGAMWDPAVKRWYAPRSRTDALRRWQPSGLIPETFDREDRTFGSGLFVDLIPRSCWFTNVRSCVSQNDWERLRRVIVGRAGETCEICGATRDPSVKRWLEVHERWDYDETSRTQTLTRLICLCTDCHTVTHFGLAQVRGLGNRAIAHLMKVTGMSRADAESHIDTAFDLWEYRNRFAWTLDISMLDGVGVSIQRPPDATGRAKTAQ
jgi:hypothetical protein